MAPHRSLLRLAPLVLMAVVGLPASAAAQAATSAGATSPAQPVSQALTEPTSATLVVLNRRILTFRGPFLGVAPTERASAAVDRIASTLDLHGPGTVTTVQVAGNIVVQLDGKLAFVVTPADANPLLDQTQADVAREATAVLERVVRESQEARDARARWRAAGYGVMYLAGALAAVFLLLRARRAIAQRVGRYAEARATKITVGGAAVMTGGSVRRLAVRALNTAVLLLIIVVIYWTVGHVLRGFPYARPWGEQMNGFFVQLLTGALHGIASATPGLLVVLVIVMGARLITGAARLFFERVRQRKVEVPWLDADLTGPTQRLFTVFVWLFALAMAYPYLPGAGSAAFDGVSVLAGLMITLGGAPAVGQGISGLMLMYLRTFKVGDFVRIDDLQGTVVGLNSFQTRIRTGAGDEVVLANSRVIGALVRNFTKPAKGGGAVLQVTVTIGYDAPWRQIHGLLTDAASATAGVAATPAPYVLQTALSDFYVEYKLVCETIPDRYQPPLVQSDLHANVQDAFNAAGVQIMSPHYFSDPAAPKVVPREKWNPGPSV